MNKKQQQQQDIQRHANKLGELYKLTTGEEHPDPMKLCKALRRLERIARVETTAQCNGYYREPTPREWQNGTAQILRQDEEGNYLDSDPILDKVREKVKKLFNGIEPKGFFINYDARGYALKIKDCKVLDTDMGGYGLMAPEY